jgi:hypothetical protein
MYIKLNTRRKPVTPMTKGSIIASPGVHDNGMPFVMCSLQSFDAYDIPTTEGYLSLSLAEAYALAARLLAMASEADKQASEAHSARVRKTYEKSSRDVGYHSADCDCPVCRQIDHAILSEMIPHPLEKESKS